MDILGGFENMIEIKKPDGWKQSTLDKVATIERLSIQPDSIKEGTKYIGLENINRGGNIKDFSIVMNGDIASSKFQFTESHILYGKLRPYLKKISRPSFLGVCSTDILPIKPSESIDKNYLFYYLRQEILVNLATTRSTGVNLPRISPKILAKFPIVYPPLEEQKRIAAILDKADGVRRKRREAIRLTEELARSLFLDMFGDPATNPKGWDVVKLEELTNRPITYGILKPGEHNKNGIPMLRIQDLEDGTVKTSGLHCVSQKLSDQYNRTILKGGEILVSLVGTLGTVGVVPKELYGANIHRNLGLIDVRSDLINPRFIASYLIFSGVSSFLKRRTKGGVQSLFNLSDLRELPVFLPSRKLQEEFDTFYQKHDLFYARSQKFKQQSENLFNSLLQRAFRGDL
ncbi:restriction endonuclease subunit S [Spirulina major CS-329]|uniref:restriction endonuclease subunit S n=1 Tax=Spirulina sp. TaxID=1157 RepID=UPI003F6F40AE|nr:restriction endonuclease subunit S [Spirulina subsalsa CS-330]MDB9504434.1 restriction endonuclease subunit S [Spirulina major CS-329]